MIKPESLEFPPLHCSLDRELGDYYQDFSGAITLVESGYHGDVDANGVPLVALEGQGQFTNAVSTSQYALANMTAVRRGDAQREPIARAQLEWLVGNQEPDGVWAGCWLMRHDSPKYRWLSAPWTGSLASGNAISALLRGWEMFDDARYRAAADAAYAGLHAEHEGLELHHRGGGSLWYEEYPGTPPLHVLNGHIYTLLAVLDYARVSGDAEAQERWRLAATTALWHLGEFDLGYWSAYDLRFLEPTSVHYHNNIHIPQLRILATLTGEAGFSEMADRWQQYGQSPLCRARWAVALRMRRFQRQR